jgi:hypothetical protein
MGRSCESCLVKSQCCHFPEKSVVEGNQKAIEVGRRRDCAVDSLLVGLLRK